MPVDKMVKTFSLILQFKKNDIDLEILGTTRYNRFCVDDDESRRDEFWIYKRFIQKIIAWICVHYVFFTNPWCCLTTIRKVYRFPKSTHDCFFFCCKLWFKFVNVLISISGQTFSCSFFFRWSAFPNDWSPNYAIWFCFQPIYI